MTVSDGRPAALIAGVAMRRLVPHRDTRGELTELYRDTWGLGLRPMQWNISDSQENVLRGVHVHREHVDYLTLVAGEMILLLHDLRDHSPTYRRTDKLRLDAEDRRMVVIPPGVAHGFYFPRPSCHVYAMTHEFDGSDEFGCRWDAPELLAEWPCHDPILSPRDAAAGSYDALRHQLRF